jgi:hypothetical protein
MVYTYKDLCEWRKEAQIELKKYKAGMGRTKGFINRVDKTQKGLSIFSKICESGIVTQIIERIRK